MSQTMFAIAGLGLLALAMTGVVFLIADVMFGTPAAMAIAAIVLAIFVTAWFAVPLWRKIDDRNGD